MWLLFGFASHCAFSAARMARRRCYRSARYHRICARRRETPEERAAGGVALVALFVSIIVSGWIGQGLGLGLQDSGRLMLASMFIFPALGFALTWRYVKRKRSRDELQVFFRSDLPPPPPEPPLNRKEPPHPWRPY